jgi:hypothetical protein
MSNLEPRPGARMTRKQRADRAYKLTLATGGLTVVAIVGILLAAIDVIGAGIPIIAAILAAVCLVLLRQTLGRS